MYRKGFSAIHPKPSGWTHTVMNYAGPNEGDGVRIFFDGAEVARDTTIDVIPKRTSTSRTLIVGRYYYHWDTRYSAIQVDELMLFNHTLSMDEIKQTQGSFY